MTTKVLFVCLGNICRSPAAEGVFLRKLKAKGLSSSFEVDSAGTGAWHAGSPADLRMKNAAQKRGIFLTSLARQINEKDFQIFDFILTMDNDNYETINLLAKESNEKINATIRPFLSYAKKYQLMEVPDPYYGGESGFEKVLDLIEDACDGFIDDFIENL